VRAAYWLGTKPLSQKGIRPYLVAAGGLAQVDATVVVIVDEATGDPLRLAAWRKTGQMFVAGGAGLVYALKANSGILLELKVQEMFGTPGTAMTLSGGYTFGL